METILAWILGIRNAVWNALLSVFPFFTDAQRLQRLGRGLHTLLRLLALLGIVTLLWWLNGVFHLERVLQTKQSVAWLRPYWLPLLGLLVIGICWLGYLVYRLLSPEEDISNFPKLDAAWEEINAALRKAGIGWADAPVFLVLGRNLGGDQALFRAARYDFLVKAPVRSADQPEPPIRCYANREIIFLTAGDASLLSRFAEFLSTAAEEETVEKTLNLYQTMAAGQEAAPGDAREAVDLLQTVHRHGRSAGQLTEEEQDQLRQIARKPRGSLLRNRNEVSRSTARLRHICRRLFEVRRPGCPLNGLMLLLPWYALDSEAEAADAAQVCRQDLDTVRQTLQLDCPVFLMVCDLEEAGGMRELLAAMPEEDKERRRIGFRFPLVPDEEPQKVKQRLAEAVRWVCHTWVPSRVFKSFQLERSAGSMAGVVKRNSRLFRLLHQFQQRQRWLRRIVVKLVLPEKGTPALFGGCYLAATGRSESSQAFIAAVFRRLSEEQTHLVWSETAYAEERWYHKWTLIGYAAWGCLVALGLAVLVLTYLAYKRDQL